jgi:exosome complex component RRP40
MSETDSPAPMVFPGDIIKIHNQESTRLGVGILQEERGVTSLRCGVLRRHGYAGSSEARPILWVDSTSKRYHPQVEDMVIGTIVDKYSEAYRVDIGCAQPAVLSAIAFEGATRRNKPNIDVGQVVYCRVAVANKFMEVELCCTSPHFKKDWVTGESIFGELKGGLTVPISLRMAHQMMDESNPLLEIIGAKIRFEVAIGVNGVLWINSDDVRHTIIISNIVTKVDSNPATDVRALLDRALQVLSKSE